MLYAVLVCSFIQVVMNVHTLAEESAKGGRPVEANLLIPLILELHNLCRSQPRNTGWVQALEPEDDRTVART